MLSDGGVLGSEEQEIIAPAIAACFEDGIMAFGPFAAGGFFGMGDYLSFDGIVSMYHDQGLAPFKTLAGEKGVNFTAGLPFVRTSPDHGTAFGIAWKGRRMPLPCVRRYMPQSTYSVVGRDLMRRLPTR